VHELRLKNMSLRTDVAKLSHKLDLKVKENNTQRTQVLALEKKSASDCTEILNLVK
jgi:low affinity Fe/Cu permease